MATGEQETTIRVSCDTFHTLLKCARQAFHTSPCRRIYSTVAQRPDEPSRPIHVFEDAYHHLVPSSRFSGDTLFSVSLLMSALYVLSSLQNRTSSQMWFGTRGSSRAQRVDKPCAVRVPTVFPLLKRLDQAQVCPHEWWSSGVSSH